MGKELLNSDKELLLQDLCARLPYGVKIDITYSKDSGSSLRARLCSEGINTLDTNILWLFQQSEIYIKPYLFPLSSMTDTQREEYESLCIKETSECIDISGFSYTKDNYYDTVESIDYLYKNHIDIRGLIPKGLAIDCTNLNIY